MRPLIIAAVFILAACGQTDSKAGAPEESAKPGLIGQAVIAIAAKDAAKAEIPPNPIAPFAGKTFTTSSHARAAMSACDGEIVKVSILDEKCFPKENAARARIDASIAKCAAPCGVHFTAEALGFRSKRPFHQLSYIWSFDDPSAKFKSLAGDFPFGADANHAQGPFAAHVFEKPGRYLVTLAVADRKGEWAKATSTVEVRDPDEAFGGRDTICYSANGDFSGCPARADKMEDLAGAARALAKFGGGRLLLRAGETTQLTAALVFRGGSFRISRFGAGAPPALRAAGPMPRMLWFRDSYDVTVSGLRFVGGYNAATGLGDTADEAVQASDSSDVTIYGNSFDGLGLNFHPRAFDGAIFADNEVTNWWNFGVLVPRDKTNERLAIIGNSIRQRADAASGPGGKSRELPRYADHGPIRVAYAPKTVIAQNDLRSLNGWSGGGKDHQPALRYNTDGTDGHAGVIVENRMEGGYTAVELVIANAGVVAGLGDTLIERNIILGTENTRLFIVSGFGNLTIRNNLIFMPAVDNNPKMRSITVMTSRDQKTAENAAAPIDLINNTLVSLRPDNGLPHILIPGQEKNPNPIATIREANNLTVFPRVINAKEYSSFDPLDAADFYRPLGKSKALSKAVASDLVFDTLDGRARGATPSVGALER